MAVQVGTVWSDLDHKLIQDSQGQLKTVINVDAVLSSVSNIVRTYRGERVMLPEFGSSFRKMVFESMSSPLIDIISQGIKDEIERWDDRVTVVQVQYFTEPDDNAVLIQVSFTIKGYYKIFKQKVHVQGDS